MRRHERNEPDVADLNDLRVIIENGQKLSAEGEDKPDGYGKGDEALEKAQKHCLFAATDVRCAVVLPDKGGACLTEGVENIIRYDLNVKRSAGCRHDDGPEAVYSALNNDVCHGEYRALQTGGQTDPQDALHAF